jgi:hypothetical protein
VKKIMTTRNISRRVGLPERLRRGRAIMVDYCPAREDGLEGANNYVLYM